MLSRRSLLAAGAAALACHRRKSTGFDGYAFVANEEGQAIAAVDLTAFAVIRHIHVDGNPTEVVTADKAAVYALTPANGSVHEIEADRLKVARKAQFGASAVSMKLSAAGKRLFILYREPRVLVCASLDGLNEEWRVDLPEEPIGLDVSHAGDALAISFGAAGAIGLVNIEERRLHRLDTGARVGITRFRRDGKALITADTERRMLLVHDVPSRRLMVRLPLAVQPEHFCFNADGGQLYVTGPGLDAVVVAYPYHTPQIAETVIAGREPRAMAASGSDPQYLFVANPASGDVTILNIPTRRVIAVASVGAHPAHISVTPDNQYALVLNQKSGDMGVLIIRSDMANRRKSAGLFTMIPVGSKPVSAAIRAA